MIRTAVMPGIRPLLATVVAALALSSTASAQGPTPVAAKKPLDHAAYGIWNRIAGSALSSDGRFALYALASDSADGTLHIAGASGAASSTIIPRGTAGIFTDDGRFVVFRISPEQAAVRQAKKEKKKPDQMPQDSMGILDVSTGAVTKYARVRSFKVPSDASNAVAILFAKADAKPDSVRSDSTKTPAPAPGATPVRTEEPGKMPEPNPTSGAAPAPKAAKEAKRDEGTELVVRTLATGQEQRIADVVSYDFSDDGRTLVYVAGNKAGTADGVYSLDVASGAVSTLLSGKGNYRQVALSKNGQVAFLSNTADFTATQPEFSVYLSAGAAPAKRVVAPGATALPRGWWVSDNSTLSFSESGARVFFGTAPRPEPEPDSAASSENEVKVDIWNWKDPLLQPMQLKRLDLERRRTYRAMVSTKDGRIVQLATAEIPEITVANRNDGDVALASTSLPYQQQISWDESASDYYLVDLKNGSSTRILEGAKSFASLSPEGKYITWFDQEARQWFAMDTRSRTVRQISTGIPTALQNEDHDTPDLPNAYGSAGWTLNDDLFLVYDRMDIWAVDPTGKRAPRNITEGIGRRDNLRFRYVRLDTDERAIDPAKDMTLSSFHLWTKQDGFYRDRVNGAGQPARLITADKSLGAPRKAEDADVIMLTRADFSEYPDLWITDTNFRDWRRISEANPQQSEYVWGTSELVSWRSGDGQTLQGVLYKPEGFDPSKKYPMMVYFYERLSDGVHNYVTPAAGSSSINTSFYVSRGYLVFTPDIPYRTGYPGESAFKAVVPGVLSLIAQGFVDENRVGVQGHSWGGYQIAYLVTKTNLFRAAEAGAPVANMTSAYGGIRWGTGMSRAFQYEKTQSRIGGTLWDAPMHFIENSPIFWADKVETPLLMMHNDEDGAVPWEQGIEYFSALRRLHKPVWLVVYNGEDHGLGKPQNRLDWTIRMQQYFDHYLKDAPAPVWLEQGVPALEKGKNLGLDLVTDGK
jgi:dipeptidyl aminopeptidase/acylaminoacyl peptidase